MQIFVINLEKDVERRVSIENQLEKLDLDFEFFKAYYGKDLTTEELHKHFNHRRAYRNWSFNFPLSVVGCALSHVMLYKKIIDEKIELACIFEDDIVLPPDTKTVLESLDSVISKTLPQVILLSESHSDIEIVHNIGDYVLKSFVSGYFTSSYIVNQKAAKILYNHLYPVHQVADCWNYLKHHKIIDILSLSPRLIEQDQETFGSSTTDGQNEQNIKKIASSLRYKFHRTIFKSLDYFIGFYNRNFNPYAGIQKKTMKPIRLYMISFILPFIPETRGFWIKKKLYQFAGASIGKHAKICTSVKIRGNGVLQIGENTWVGHNAHIISTSNITIGANVDIAPNVYIGTGTHVIDLQSPNIAGKGTSKDVIIGNGCWVGVGSIVLPGVVIGNKCIIGAGSVVNKTFPDFSLIAGIPAVFKRKLT